MAGFPLAVVSCACLCLSNRKNRERAGVVLRDNAGRAAIERRRYQTLPGRAERSYPQGAVSSSTLPGRGPCNRIAGELEIRD
jgi:hypothetical protein